MIAFPNCKINLGLNVLQKRDDGYHDLETVFYPVSLSDALEITTASKQVLHSSQQLVSFTNSGLPIDGPADANLCVKAYHLLKNDFPELPPVQMHLHKVIPMGAGLGGGSANAACTLTLLNDYFELLLTKQQLIDYAAKLGSDCPFFIINKPCFATSRGEMLEQLSLDLSPFRIVLVNSPIHINTGWAFAQLNLLPSGNYEKGKPALKELIRQPIESWKNQVLNDFEDPVFRAYPGIRAVKDMLYDQGALFAAMTGSGSTVFGIFAKNTKPVLNITGAEVFVLD